MKIMGQTWEWKRNNGHRKQPLPEFYLEQFLSFSTLYLFRAARADVVTLSRSSA